MISGPIRVLENQAIAGNSTPVTIDTAHVPCMGALQVDFHISTSSAVNFGAEAIALVSDNGVNVWFGSGQNITIRNGTLNGNAAQNKLVVSIAPASGLRFGWRTCALRITGNGTGGQNIAGLTVDAFAHFEDNVAKNLAQPVA